MTVMDPTFNISGSLQVGHILSAAPNFVYQWFRNGVPIAGAVSSTYTVTSADIGAVITATRVESSHPTQPPVPANTTAPTIVGTAQVGQSLAATTGVWTNSPTSFTYQWKRGVAPIAGATASSYVPVVADVGNTLKVSVVATNAAGDSPPATSAASIAIVSGPLPANMALPVISGTLQNGQTLTTTNGTWTNSPSSFAYQWLRGGVAIGGGATASTYIPVAADVGSTLAVSIIATNQAGDSVPAASAATGPVVDIIPSNTALPAISGTLQVGATLTATPGTWTNNPTSFSYQWTRGGISIPNAITSMYVLTAADIGSALMVSVVATNSGGSSAAATSSPSGVVIDLIPTNVAPPAISGTAQVGQTLTATAGTWTHNPTSFTYQWKRGGTTTIAGATGSTYVPISADLGTALTVSVIATNSGGSSAAATSAATAPVADVSPGVGVSVATFGAVGDGVTDDTAALLTAAASNQILWFPKTSAFYKTTAVIPLLKGAYSNGAEIRLAQDGTAAKSILKVASNTAPMTIDGLVLNGLYATGAAANSASAGIDARSASGLTITNNTIKNTVGDAIYLGTDPSVAPINVALNKTATASSSYDNTFLPANAVDGATATSGPRWASQFTDPQWLSVDLGSNYPISRIKLYWATTTYATAFQVQWSNDAINWTTIYTTTTGTGGITDLTGLSFNARYLRMYGTARATPYDYSLHEFEVYGTPSVPNTNINISNNTLQNPYRYDVGIIAADGVTIRNNTISKTFDFGPAIVSSPNGGNDNVKNLTIDTNTINCPHECIHIFPNMTVPNTGLSITNNTVHGPAALAILQGGPLGVPAPTFRGNKFTNTSLTIDQNYHYMFYFDYTTNIVLDLNIDYTAPGGGYVSLFVSTTASIAVNTNNTFIVLPSTPPSVLPAYFAFGLRSDSNNQGWMPGSGVPWNFRYQYLNVGWENWNSPSGQIVTNYIQYSSSIGTIAIFDLYLAGSQMAGSLTTLWANLASPSYMLSYFTSVKLLLQKAGAFTTTPVILHIEPDMWAFMQQQLAFNPNSVNVSVASSGFAGLGGFANTASGFAQALVSLRNTYAPNVLLAWDSAPWGVNYDPIVNAADPTTYGGYVGGWFNASGAAFDLIFHNMADRTAGYKVAVVGQTAASAWWNDTTYTRFQQYVGKVSQMMIGVKGMLWQIPVGNTLMRSCNNANFHFQGNHVEYFLAAGNTQHIRDYIAAGITAVLFGEGIVGDTSYYDAAGDGVTNPAAINGNPNGITNVTVATVSDDDGGFLRAGAAAYYTAGPISLLSPSSLHFPPDTTARPLIAQASLAVPGYLVPTTDPSLGNMVMRISDSPTFGGSVATGVGNIRMIKHHYAKDQAWNADESLIYLEQAIYPGALLDGTTYQYLRQLPSFNANQERIWSNTNKDLMYGISSNPPAIKTLNVQTGVQTTIATFPAYSWLSLGSYEGNLDNNDHYMCLMGQSGTSMVIFTYDLINHVVVGSRTFANTGQSDNIDFCTVTPSGQYVAIGFDVGSPFGFPDGSLQLYDINMNYLRQISTTKTHVDFNYDIAGNEVAVGNNTSTGDIFSQYIYSVRLSNGVETRHLPPGSVNNPTHTSCRNIQRPGWGYFSEFANTSGGHPVTYYNPYFNYNEIFAVKLDGSGTIERFAKEHHVTDPAFDYNASDGYNRCAMATVSRKGNRIIFASDWGDSSLNAFIHTYVAWWP